MTTPHMATSVCVFAWMQVKHPGRGTIRENQASPPEPSGASFEIIPCVSQPGCTVAMLCYPMLIVCL